MSAQIIPFTREVIRYQVTDGRTVEMRQLYIDGATEEVIRTIYWAVALDGGDGWQPVKGTIRFGTIQNGEFRERVTRKVPLLVNGWRRMSPILRA